MKKTFLAVIIAVAGQAIAYGQSVPIEIQQRLQEIEEQARIRLDEFRLSDEGRLPRIGRLSTLLSHAEITRINDLGLELDVGMVFDDAMRDRIVQLMRMEFREEELDTLVERTLNRMTTFFEGQAMRASGIDTLSIFRDALADLLDSLEAQNTLDIVKKMNRRYDLGVFKALQLDTLSIFKQALNEIIESERARWRERFLAESRYINTTLVELAGHIGDERFVQPLIEALDIPNQHENRRRFVTEALIRMRVEPYFSEFTENRTRAIEQIKSERPPFRMREFVLLWGTQEAFLELSKYLLSDIPYALAISDEGVTVGATAFEEAFVFIKDNIKNADLQEMLKGKTGWDNPELRMPLYEWMQANFGNYEIRRIW